MSGSRAVNWPEIGPNYFKSDKNARKEATKVEAGTVLNTKKDP